MHRRIRIDQIFGKDATVLAEWIEEVKQYIGARQSLAADALAGLDSHLFSVERELGRVSHWSPGYKPSADRRRSDLENQLERLLTEQREHRLSLWRDLEAMRKELRLLVKEYRKAKRRQNLLQYGENND
jgi:hypothetical protein